jgi:hypothetical protein
MKHEKKTREARISGMANKKNLCGDICTSPVNPRPRVVRIKCGSKTRGAGHPSPRTCSQRGDPFLGTPDPGDVTGRFRSSHVHRSNKTTADSSSEVDEEVSQWYLKDFGGPNAPGRRHGNPRPEVS